jgi:hypothetical protein
LVKTFRPINYWQVYMLTGRGHERLRENQRASFMHPIQGVGEAYLRHEITVCGVGLVMTELLGLKVETARQTWEQIRRRGVLRKGDSKLTFPDLIAVDAQGDRHTIEVELTAKSRERYRELFSDRKGLWRRQQRWSDQEKCWKGGTVLYLTGWPTGVEHIIHLARKSQAGSVHAASLSDFRASLGRCEYEKLSSVGGRRKFSLTAAKAAPLAEVAA